MVPLESTDGKYLYYSKGDSSTSIWRVSVTGGEEVQVVDSLGGWPNFDVVSDGIYYIPVRLSSREYKVQFRRFVDGKTQTVATFNEGVSGISVSPDRRTLIAGRWENYGRDLMVVENFR